MKTRPFVHEVQRAVAQHYQLRRADLLSQRRSHNVLRARWIAMYLADVMTGRNHATLGRLFGGRDHATVHHALRAMRGRVADDQELAREIFNLRLIIEEDMQNEQCDHLARARLPERP